MASEVQICNMALRGLGLNTITSLDEPTPQAVDCKLFYPQCRNFVLRDFPWSFARRRKPLAATDVPEGYADQYTYAYFYPNACARFLKMRAPGSKTAYPFERVLTDTEQRLLVCDVNQAVGEFTGQVTNTVLFDAMFVQALVLLLSAPLAVSLRKDQALRDMKHQEYAAMVDQAKVASLRETAPTKTETVPWIAARTGSN